jgi:hypothetical protein
MKFTGHKRKLDDKLHQTERSVSIDEPSPISPLGVDPAHMIHTCP